MLPVVFLFFFPSGLSVLMTAGSSGLDCILPEGVQPLLPLLLLGLQVLFMLIELAAHGTCFLGPQIQGLVLLALIEFPEVLFLILVNDGIYEPLGSWRVWKPRRLSL